MESIDLIENNKNKLSWFCTCNHIAIKLRKLINRPKMKMFPEVIKEMSRATDRGKFIEI